MEINKFGQRSLVTWTAEDLRKEREAEMNKEYICLSNDETFTKDELHCCPHCGKFSCPTCGGEVSTIEEYDEFMRVNARES